MPAGWPGATSGRAPPRILRREPGSQKQREWLSLVSAARLWHLVSLTSGKSPAGSSNNLPQRVLRVKC